MKYLLFILACIIVPVAFGCLTLKELDKDPTDQEARDNGR